MQVTVVEAAIVKGGTNVTLAITIALGLSHSPFNWET